MKVILKIKFMICIRFTWIFVLIYGLLLLLHLFFMFFPFLGCTTTIFFPPPFVFLGRFYCCCFAIYFPHFFVGYFWFANSFLFPSFSLCFFWADLGIKCCILKHSTNIEHKWYFFPIFEVFVFYPGSILKILEFESYAKIRLHFFI